MKKENMILILMGLILLTGCAGTNQNYFQTGKPCGKDSVVFDVSINTGSAVNYKVTDEIGESPVIDIKENKKWFPLLNFQLYGTVHEHIDIGVG